MSEAGAPSQDDRDLARFGYRPRLARTLGSFSSFAVGFAYISILTGLFQMFRLGFGAGGPAFFWTWPVVLLGQFLVALNFAELAAHYPLCGGVYQWSRHVGSGRLGWIAGWIYVAASVISLAAVSLALGETLPRLDPRWRLLGGGADAVTKNTVLLGCLLIAATTALNAFGPRIAARFNNIGVAIELVGAVALIGLLIAYSRRGPGIVLERLNRGGGEPLGYFGALLTSALTASYVLYGFDTAGLLAEETESPRKRAPRAILQALAAAGVIGGLMILAGLMSARDLNDEGLGRTGGGMGLIVEGVLGTGVGRFFVGIAAVAIFACALSVHTSAARLVFAMARDGSLPRAGVLARVWGTTQTPMVAVLLVGVLAAMILLANLNYESAVNTVAIVAILWANLAYLLVTAPLLRLRLRGWPRGEEVPATGVFSLGRWGVLINALAVIWGVLMLLNVGWPRAEVFGSRWHERFGAVLWTLAILAVGGTYYGLSREFRVLDEHRAKPPSNAEV